MKKLVKTAKQQRNVVQCIQLKDLNGHGTTERSTIAILPICASLKFEMREVDSSLVFYSLTKTISI
jgi:hypothetical protein